MGDPKKLKKSETIEIRLAHAVKQAFMARCRSADRSASEVLRDFILDYVDGRTSAPLPAHGRLGGPLRWAAAAAALLAAGALAGPTLARPSLPAVYERLDADHDGRLTFDEFSRAAVVNLSLASDAGAPVAASAALRRSLLREEFERIDVDRDGEISFAEFRRFYARRPT